MHEDQPIRRDLESQSQPSLTSNPRLEDICNSIRGTSPDWDKLTTVYERRKINQTASTHGLLGEIVLESILHTESTNGKINLYPISRNTETENYFFRRKKRNVVVYNNASAQPIVEYDAIVVADSLPVIFESKLNDNH